MIRLLKKIAKKELHNAAYRMKSVAGNALSVVSGIEGDRRICEAENLLPEIKRKETIR